MNGTAEMFVAGALLLASGFLFAARKRSVCLVSVGLMMAASWSNSFVPEFRMSAALLLVQQIIVFSILVLILRELLRPRIGFSDPPLQIRGRILAGIAFLSVAIAGIAGYMIAGSNICLVAAVVAVLAHVAVMTSAMWLRSGAASLLYPAVCLVLVVQVLRLAPECQNLAFIYSMEQQAERKAVPNWPRKAPVELSFECLHHRHSGVRRSAVRHLAYEIEKELVLARDEYGKDLNLRADDWWKHAWFEGKSPAPQVTGRGLPLLAELLEDDDPLVRIYAANALGCAGPIALPVVPKLLRLLREQGQVDASRSTHESRSALTNPLQIGSESLGQFETGLHPEILRGTVADAIGSIGPGAIEAVPDLTLLLEDIYWPIRVKASNALARIGPPARAALPMLEKAVDDVLFGEPARVAAASAIWWIDRHHAMVEQILSQILDSGTPEGRIAAAVELRMMGPPVADWAVPRLIALLENESPDVRLAAFESLCSAGAETAAAVNAIVQIVSRQLGAENQEDKLAQWRRDSGIRYLVKKSRGPGANALALVIRDGDRELVRHILLICGESASWDVDRVDPAVAAAVQDAKTQGR